MTSITLAGLPAQDAIVQAVGSIVVGTAVNMGLQRFFAGQREIDGCPLWNYFAAMIFQAVIFPGLLYLSVSEYPSWDAHAAGTWADCGDGCYMRVLHVVMLGYLAKDMLYCTVLQQIHHVAGLIITSAFMYAGSGAHGYMTGCIVLETANFFYNYSSVGSQRTRTWYAVAIAAFTAAHVVGLSIVFRFVVQSGKSTSPGHWFVLVASLGLCAMRQREVHARWSSFKAKKK